MAVSLVAVGAKSAGGTTTVSIASPAGTAAGQQLLAFRAAWVSGVSFTDETDWTSLGSLAGGTGSSADAHTGAIRGDRRLLSGSLAGPTVFDQTFSGGGSGCLGIMLSYENDGGTWDIVSATGDDSSHGTNRSITASSSIDLAPGDVVVVAVEVDTDTSLASFANQAITASGITFGSTTRHTSGAGVGTGSDGNIEVFEATVSSGSGTVAPTLTFDTTTNQCGPGLFVRLREPSGTDYTETPTDDVGVTDTVTAAKSIAQTVSDDAGVDDTVTRVAPANRTVTDPVGVDDSVTAAKAITVTITDEVGVTDETLPAKIVTIADDVGVTDSVTAVKTITQTISDDVGVDDTTERVVSYVREISDDVAADDTVEFDKSGLTSETVTDPVGVDDTVERAHTANRSVTDPVGVEDTVTAAKTIVVVITEEVGATDELSRTFSVVISDDVAVDDTTTKSLGIGREVSDDVGAADFVDRVVSYVREVTESVGVDDTVDPAIQLPGFWVKDPVGYSSDPAGFVKAGVGFRKRRPEGLEP